MACGSKPRPEGRRGRCEPIPARFFVPSYVGPSGWVGVYLDEQTRWDELADILRDAHGLAGAPAARKR